MMENEVQEAIKNYAAKWFDKGREYGNAPITKNMLIELEKEGEDMCESYENAIAEQCHDDGFTEGWDNCKKYATKTMKQAMSEMGIPQPSYPANVSNAYRILKDGLQRMREGPVDEDYLTT